MKEDFEMATFMKVNRIIMAIALAVLVMELLTASANVIGYMNRGCTFGQAVQWEMDETLWAWKRIFPDKPEEKTWVPLMNQNIDWNWQSKEKAR